MKAGPFFLAPAAREEDDPRDDTTIAVAPNQDAAEAWQRLHLSRLPMSQR